MSNIDMLHRTLIDPLQRRVDAGEITGADRDEILGTYDEARTIIADVEKHAQEIAGDLRLTRAGKAAALAEAGRRLRDAIAPIVARVQAAQAAHAAFEARAPFLVRVPDGTYRDTRGERRDTSPEAELLRELRDRQRWDYLLAHSPVDRGALQRRLADSGNDPDEILAASLRASRFMNLIDEGTRRYVVEAHLRRQGLDAALERSAFKAGALARLGEAIDAALTDLGAPEHTTPETV